MFHTACTGGVMLKQVYPLRGTVFMVSPETLSVLGRSVRAHAFMGGPASIVPPNIPGYTGQPLGIWVPTLAGLLAQCGPAGSPDGVNRPNTEHRTLNTRCLLSTAPAASCCAGRRAGYG